MISTHTSLSRSILKSPIDLVVNVTRCLRTLSTPCFTSTYTSMISLSPGASRTSAGFTLILNPKLSSTASRSATLTLPLFCTIKVAVYGSLSV